MSDTSKWKDFYNIPDKQDYIHSNRHGFEYILSKNNMSAKDILKDTQDNLTTIIIEVYKDILSYWAGLRKTFIEAFVKEGLTKETDPTSFLKDFNQVFKNAVSQNVTMSILNWKKWSIQLYKKSGLKDLSALKKNEKTINQAFENLMTMLVDLINYHDSYLEDWNKMIFNLPEKQKKEYNLNYSFGRESDKKKKQYPLSFLLDTIKTFANLLGIQANNTQELIQSILDYKMKIDNMNAKDPDKALAYKEFAVHASSKQTITKNFVSFIEGAATAPEGYVGLTDSLAIAAEYTSQDALAKSNMNKKDIEGLDITNLKGIQLSERTTIDQILISLGTDESDQLIFGASWKLRNEPILKSQYAKSNYEDFLPKDKIDFLYWFRRNFIALSKWERSGDMYASSVGYGDFIDFETSIASLMALPRMLDGIIDYTDGVALKDFNGSKYHNAIIMLDNENWTWVYDVISYLIEALQKSYKGSGISGALASGTDAIKEIEEKIATNIENVSVSDLTALWEKKKAIIKEFSKVTRYDLLYTNLGADMQTIVNQSFAKAPIEGIYLTLNLGKFIGKH